MLYRPCIISINLNRTHNTTSEQEFRFSLFILCTPLALSLWPRKPFSTAQLQSFWGLLCLPSSKMVYRKMLLQRSFGRLFSLRSKTRLWIYWNWCSRKSLLLFRLSSLLELPGRSEDIPNSRSFLGSGFSKNLHPSWTFASPWCSAVCFFARCSFSTILEHHWQILPASTWKSHSLDANYFIIVKATLTAVHYCFVEIVDRQTDEMTLPGGTSLSTCSAVDSVETVLIFW